MSTDKSRETVREQIQVVIRVSEKTEHPFACARRVFAEAGIQYTVSSSRADDRFPDILVVTLVTTAKRSAESPEEKRSFTESTLRDAFVTAGIKGVTIVRVDHVRYLGSAALDAERIIESGRSAARVERIMRGRKEP